MRDELKLIRDSAESEKAASKVQDNGGVYLVPAFAGLGAPYWDMRARGSIFGLTAGVNKYHIVRAALESIAYQTEDVIDAMNADINLINSSNNAQNAINVLKVDGGASANDLLMQTQSDVSGISVLRSSNAEATAAGAAYLAGLAVGFWKNKDELRSLSGAGIKFEPQIDCSERAKRLNSWHRAISACREYTKTEE